MTGSGRQSARIAVDLLGGDDAPAVVVEGVLRALSEDPQLRLLIAAPHPIGEELLHSAGISRSGVSRSGISSSGISDAGVQSPGVQSPGVQSAGVSYAERLVLLPATDVVSMAAAPASAVRAQSDATVRVAIRALAAGDADAVVTLGSSGAAVTSAVLDLGLLPGVERPALAVVIPSASGPLVLLDVGANVRVDPALLVNHAMLGAAFAHGVLGLEAPRVGLLSNGLEPGKGGAQRVEAAAALAVLCAELSGSVPSVRFIGNVEGHHVPLGGLADVVVTDGMIGNVLLKGMEGTWELLRKTDAIMEDSLGQTARSALLLGVAGLVVVGHGAARGTDVAACIHTAATAVRENWFHHFRAVQTDLSSRADSLNRA